MSPHARSDGLRISYDDLGPRDGTAYLLMPGWCGGRSVFEPLAKRLSATHRTLVLDWRGHGASGDARDDFGTEHLVEDALAVVRDAGVREVVPVALSHAGWVALALRRRLGARVRGLVLLDWIVLDAPAPFLGALQALQDPAASEPTREALFGMWLAGSDHPAVARYVRGEMAATPGAMWSRAGREIAASYRAEGAPLGALAALAPPVPTLHLFAQPADPGYLEAQEAFSKGNPWFSARRVEARTHFPLLEIPDAAAAEISRFVARLPGAGDKA